MKMKDVAVVLGVLLFSAVPSYAQSPSTYTVDDDGPADFSTIGDALAACVDGDTVLVMAGEYEEDVVVDQSVTVSGAGSDVTTIRGSGTGSVVLLSGVTQAKFTGFTVTGAGSLSTEAGVRIVGGSPLVRNNRIEGNLSLGVLISGGSTATIENNTISGNGSEGTGHLCYGICCLSSNVVIAGNVVVQNNYAAGIYVAWAAASGTVIVNNTIADNEYEGVWCYQSSPLIANNIIVSNNTGISASHTAVPEISYNDVWDNEWKGLRCPVGRGSGGRTGGHLSGPQV